MSAIFDPSKLATLKFGVGQPVRRTEDPTLLRGEGRYTDDLNRPGQLYATIVRSREAHGFIRSIDIDAAKAMPGVRGVYTARDIIAAGFGTTGCGMPFTNRDGSAMQGPRRTALALEKVRYVGDPVAFVVADTAYQAKDAAEAVSVEIDPLPAATRASDAAAEGAAQIHDELPGNVALDYHYGDAAATAAAFEAAAHVVTLPLTNNRVVVSAMEPRSAIGEYDPASERWTLRVGCQGVFGLRNLLAKDILKTSPDKVHVLTGNVGGSFGMKAFVYPEYICLFHAARSLGQPVKWTDERSESFLSDNHGRDHEMTASLALSKEGDFLAVRITGYGNLGAYLDHVAPIPSTLNAVKNVIGVYLTPLVEVSSQCVITNTPPVGPYRGAGRPEGNYYMERLIDAAAAQMGVDRIELRRRNHIRPDAMPYQAPSGMPYDSGDFPGLLTKALDLADWSGFAARKADSKARGKLRGLGIGQYLEVTAPPTNEQGGVRFEPNGDVTIITGTLDYGQGHAAPFAQVLTQALGVPFDKIKLIQGDSDLLIAGGGTGGSKSIMASGAAILQASEKVIEKGKQIAGFVLEAATADIEFDAGRFTIAGTDRSIDVMELSARLHGGMKLPPDLPQSLDVTEVFEAAPSAFPNGCHIAEVEIDPETGVAEVVRYTMVNDFGVVVNPMIVEAQAHGGIVQGIGQALMEHVVFDDQGQLLTGSYMDYAVPRASDAPNFAFGSHSVPSTTNPMGSKGCGEAGCAGALPSVMNAVVDALSVYGVTHMEMPATPLRIWETIQAASAKAA